MSEDPKQQLALTPVAPQQVPVVVEQVTESYSTREDSDTDDSVPLSHYLWILRRHKWRILAFVAVSVAATIIVSARLTPYYESTATIDIDRQLPAAAVGQDSRTPVNDSEQFLATQIRLIQSPSVLRPVAQSLRIGTRGASAVPGTPAPIRDADVKSAFSSLKVVRPANTYLIQISYRSPSPQFAADVANAIAHSYIEHNFDVRVDASGSLALFMQKQLDGLRAKMERSSEALAQLEKDLNLLNPDEKTSFVSARLLQLNTELTNAETDKVRKEAALALARSGDLEALQASAQGDQQAVLSSLIQRINDAKEKFETARAKLGTQHPDYIKANKDLAELDRQFQEEKLRIARRVDFEYQEAADREAKLQASLDTTKAEYDQTNAGSFQYKALKQEADADKALYDELTRHIKEATINSGFQNDSIRLADAAEAANVPIFPDTRTNAMIAFLASLLIAGAVAILSDSLDQTIKDPDRIQRQLNTEVLGSLPVVKGWRGRLALTSGQVARSSLTDTSGIALEHQYEEAIRSLRDALLLSQVKRPRTILVTSATPREGKTTTAVHLAIAHSQQKRRTLLIDADLRRPGVFHHLGIPNKEGLTDVVRGTSEWRSVLNKIEALPYLDVLSAGPASRKAADGIGSTLPGLLTDALQEYDLVICDAPPLLGFAESLQIASLVDGVVVVALAGQTNQNAVASVFASLRRLRVNILGLALNEVRPEMSDRYYYYGYYGKYYSKYYKPLDN